ncbi:hypothetical protein Tco_1293438 [Tanacetum coccineum]
MLGEIDEAKLQKIVDDMLRQRCNSGEEHQYHVDQMQNYFKNNIVWESRKESLSLSTPKKKALHGNLGQKKYILSLHKFPAVPFPDDDMEEQTLRWVNKRIKKRNMSISARDTGFEHGNQANEGTQGQLRRNHPTGVTP